ncbi:MAG TPA: hypothetical protein VGR03_11085 [Candidatus Acidoferrum sp.]|nr:hypothetical protein [Candidatus Acidoferrum sp.]
MQVREAKDFLVKQAVEQARVEDVPLSDLERRMMYFTEGPDAVEDPVSLNEEFEKQYDTTQYEAKLTKLLANAHKRLKTESPISISEWDKAIETLQEGDHYLLVLSGTGSLGRIPLRSLLTLAARLAVLIFAASVVWIGLKYFLKATGTSAGSIFAVVFVASLLVAAIKPQAVSDLSRRGLMWVILFLFGRRDSSGHGN